MKKRVFLSIYFKNGLSERRKKRDVTVAFNYDEPLYEKCKGFGSSKIKEIIGIYSYQELKKKADEDGRTLSNYIKHKLMKNIGKIE